MPSVSAFSIVKNEEQKICSKCLNKYPENQFYGKSARCRSCRNIKAREWQRRNKGKAKDYYLRTREQRLTARRIYYQKNKKYLALMELKRFESNPERKLQKQLRARYKINVSDYKTLLEKQNNLCAICFTPPKGTRLSVDHCHKTKRVRGLLCRKCNAAIGLLNEDKGNIQRAMQYLFGVNL